MKEEAQRIAIAEHCGWTRCKRTSLFIGRERKLKSGLFGIPPSGKLANDLPDYLNDLNAIHEAEKKLTDELHSMDLSYRSVYFHSIQKDSPASVRAEKFLRTIGKWIESSEPVTHDAVV